MKRLALVGGVIIVLLIVVARNEADAQTLGASINKVLSTYQTNVQAWQTILSGFATRLFWILALVELLVVAIRCVLKGADLGEFVADLVAFVLFVGFFYALLLNGPTWASAIVTSFAQAGNAAAQGVGGAAGVTPAQVLDDALTIVSNLWAQTAITTPGYDFELVMIGFVVIIVLGVVTAFMVEALVESYVVVYAGILFLGFGGSRFTSQYAVRVLNYAVSVGAKLFMLELIVALGMQFINQWTTVTPADAPGFVELCVTLVTMLALVVMLPSMIQSLINGASFSSGAALMGAVGTAAGTAAGLATAGLGAVGLAGAQTAAGLSSATSLGAKTGEIAKFLPRVAGNAGQAALGDLGRRLSGRNYGGSMGGRMGMDMLSRVNGGKAPDASRPPPPPQRSQQPSGFSPVPPDSGQGS
jgi:type IV secretion system protein TrbL